MVRTRKTKRTRTTILSVSDDALLLAKTATSCRDRQWPFVTWTVESGRSFQALAWLLTAVEKLSAVLLHKRLTMASGSASSPLTKQICEVKNSLRFLRRKLKSSTITTNRQCLKSLSEVFGISFQTTRRGNDDRLTLSGAARSHDSRQRLILSAR